MLFSRGKSSSSRFQDDYRAVESQTLKRWQNTASGKEEDLNQPLREVEIPVRLHESSPDYYANEEYTCSTINLTEDSAIGAKGRTSSPTDIQENKTQISPITPPHSITSDLSIPAEQDIKRRFGSNIRSALGPGTVIEGTFRFDSPVCIDGELRGEVSSSSALIVGAEANVNAKIKVGSLIVLGTVTGEIEADELVEIRAKGDLEADIITKRLVIEESGNFNGSCTMID